MSEPKHDAGDQHAGMVVVASLVEAIERRSLHCVALPVRKRYDRNGAVCRPTGSGGVARIAALYARAMSSGFATEAGRSRRFGRNPKPDASGDFHPASREIKQERKST